MTFHSNSQTTAHSNRRGGVSSGVPALGLLEVLRYLVTDRIGEIYILDGENARGMHIHGLIRLITRLQFVSMCHTQLLSQELRNRPRSNL